MKYEKPEIVVFTETEASQWAVPKSDTPQTVLSDGIVVRGMCSGDSCKCTSGQARV